MDSSHTLPGVSEMCLGKRLEHGRAITGPLPAWHLKTSTAMLWTNQEMGPRMWPMWQSEHGSKW